MVERERVPFARELEIYNRLQEVDDVPMGEVVKALKDDDPISRGRIVFKGRVRTFWQAVKGATYFVFHPAIMVQGDSGKCSVFVIPFHDWDRLRVGNEFNVHVDIKCTEF